MVTRKLFMQSATAMAAASTLQACGVSGDDKYATTASQTWHRDSLLKEDALQVRRELVRMATLAPSSHNTQCWKFRVEEHAIFILPDLSRRCPAVDPDDHHLFVSLGCATENLLQAAAAHGLQGTVQFGTAGATGATSVQVILEAGKPSASELFNAITERQCTRSGFDGKPLSNAELTLLEKAGSGPGVRLMVLTEKSKMESVLEYVVAGNTAQMADPAFMKELKTWIRFNAAEAVASGDGLYSLSSGSPDTPRWLGTRLFDLLYSSAKENQKYAAHIRSSSGIAVFVSEVEDKAHWVEVGRCYQRFVLQAAALGIRNAMLNQPVEVAALRPQFAASLGLQNKRPDLVVRFGRGPKMPQSLRRTVDSVLA